jgi:hypothetical protein
MSEELEEALERLRSARAVEEKARRGLDAIIARVREFEDEKIKAQTRVHKIIAKLTMPGDA